MNKQKETRGDFTCDFRLINWYVTCLTWWRRVSHYKYTSILRYGVVTTCESRDAQHNDQTASRNHLTKAGVITYLTVLHHGYNLRISRLQNPISIGEIPFFSRKSGDRNGTFSVFCHQSTKLSSSLSGLTQLLAGADGGAEADDAGLYLTRFNWDPLAWDILNPVEKLKTSLKHSYIN